MCSRKEKVIEIGIVFLFIGIALIAFGTRWNGYSPFVFLGGDAANIASFAAARDNPDLFIGDGVLDDVQNFRIYIHAQVYLVRFLENLFGDYGTASVVLLIPYVFLQLFGFYILGRTIFHSRYWALLLSLINVIWVNLPYSYWGIYSDPQPRMSFQALWPLLLAGVFRWKDRPARWLWIMVAVGILTYFHGVGGFVWGPVLWLGFWFLLPSSWRLRRRVWYMGVLGGVFFITVLPFLLHYLQNHALGRPPVDPELVYHIMQIRLIEGYLNIPLAITKFAYFWLHPVHAFVLVMALLGAYLMFTRHETRRRDLLLIGVWAVGIAFISALLPLIEQEIEKALGLVPTQIDLIRGLRFYVPLVLLLAIWFLAELARYPDKYFRAQHLTEPAFLVGAIPFVMFILWMLQSILSKKMFYNIAHALSSWLEPFPTLKEFLGIIYRIISKFTLESLYGWLAILIIMSVLGFLLLRTQKELLFRIQRNLVGHSTTLAMVMGLFLLFTWGASHTVKYAGPGLWIHGISCWLQGQRLCPESKQVRWDELLKEISAIREKVPPREPILATHATLPIRYGALRPVVYSYKDGGILSYTNPEALVNWYYKKQVMDRISQIKDPKQRLRSLIKFARQIGVKFLVVHRMPVEIVASMPEIKLLWFSTACDIVLIKLS